MDQLGLDPSWIASGVDLTSGKVLKLHDIENAIANLVASVFWIGRLSTKCLFHIDPYLPCGKLGISVNHHSFRSILFWGMITLVPLF
jgi:hypothetical protein